MSVTAINKHSHVEREQAVDETLSGFNTESTTDSDLKLTADTSHKVAFVDTSSSALTLTVPSNSISNDGYVLTVVDKGGNCGSNAATISSEGSENINGISSDATLGEDYGVVQFVSDGSGLFSTNKEIRSVESTTDSDLTVQEVVDKSVVFADTSSSALTVTIPTDNISRDGYEAIIKDVGGSAGARAITIATEGSGSVDGASSGSISTNDGQSHLVSDGTDLYSI